MLEFIEAVGKYEFMRNALVIGILVSVACGIIGTYVVVRRITYIAGGISHCVLGGLGAANYLRKVHGWDFLDPLYGAVAAALLAAFIIGAISLRSRQREDTVIGVLWAIGMATGVMFIMRTPGYSEDIMGYLFGNILMVSSADVKLIACLDAVVVAAGLAFFPQLMAVCFDEEFARVRGMNVGFFFMLLLCLTALTVVLMVSVVGIVMVIALLTIPAAVAGSFSRVMWKIMILSIGICALFTSGGLALSYGPNLPTGAAIILVAGFTYLVALFLKSSFFRRLASPLFPLDRRNRK